MVSDDYIYMKQCMLQNLHSGKFECRTVLSSNKIKLEAIRWEMHLLVFCNACQYNFPFMEQDFLKYS